MWYVRFIKRKEFVMSKTNVNEYTTIAKSAEKMKDNLNDFD